MKQFNCLTKTYHSQIQIYINQHMSYPKVYSSLLNTITYTIYLPLILCILGNLAHKLYFYIRFTNIHFIPTYIIIKYTPSCCMYIEGSIKTHLVQRVQQGVYTLDHYKALYSQQKLLLTVPANKKQIIQLIFGDCCHTPTHCLENQQ